MYLNPRAWNQEYGSRQSVQAYHDLLYYLELTEEYRGQNAGLFTEILSDNIHLVFHDLPLPLRYREQLIEYVVAGKPCQEEKLRKIKEYLERKKRGNLNAFESRCYDEALDVNNEKSFEIEAEKPIKIERIGREKEILEIRQKVYSKLNKGQNMFSTLNIFKLKVEKFLEDYRADLSYHEEKYWREKVIITEKAVTRNKNEIKAANHSRKDETLAPAVKEMFDAVKLSQN